MQSKKRWRRAIQALIAIGLVIFQVGPGLPRQVPLVQAASNTLVISQVYGGGGNSGSTYTHDFIELINISSSPISLSNYSVQYASATGTVDIGSSASMITPLGALELQPGHYLLIQEAQGAGGTVSLPSPDITDLTPIGIASSGGKVALVTGVNALGCGGTTPCSEAQKARIVDFLGWGSATLFEGAGPAPATSTITAALRKGDGCTDTDDNSSDFTASAPAPRNSASPVKNCAAVEAAPAVASTIPAANAQFVMPDEQITVRFSEDVQAAGTWFTLSCTISGSHTVAVSGGPRTFTLSPSPAFVSSETCTGTVLANQVTDQDSNDPPDNMILDYSWTFSIAPPDVDTINAIQGSSHFSALNGELVTNVAGIVTTLRRNGFYMQDPAPDANPDTSDGIFVFTSAAPAVAAGDAVKVFGTVAEFRGSTTSLTVTEIVSPTVAVISTSNPLPAPVILGQGGRAIPATVIEDDASNVETDNAFDPANDGIDFYESMEGMRVQVNNARVVGPSNSFGEIPVVADGGAGAGLLTLRGGLVIQPGDFNPERILLDNEILPTPAVNVGDSFPGAVVGVLDYSFNNYKLEVTTLPAVLAGGLVKEAAPGGGLYKLSVGTFNVENLSPGDTAQKFAGLAGLIVNNLKSPDILAVEEIQDNNGSTNDLVVAADVTYAMLITAIQAAGGPPYQYRQIDPQDDQDGGEPGGNIRVGFLYRTDRGLQFVDRPGALYNTPNAVLTDGGVHLQYSPGRIDPTNSAFNNSRKPLAGEFRFNGERLFVIANHFNSKGGDQPLFGRYQPPSLSSEAQRLNQAQVLHDFAAAILAADAQARVIVLGDFNDFHFSNPLKTLKGSPLILHDLIEDLPPSERYTYIYEGNSQALDHILVSDALYLLQPVYDAVHVNAEFAQQISDHDPQVMVVAFPDHPPVVDANQAIPDQAARARTPFQLTFAADLFTDVDAGDVLAFSAALADGSALPAWLKFNPLTRTFSGTPGLSDPGEFVIKITAADLANASVSTTFRLKVFTLFWLPSLSKNP